MEMNWISVEDKLPEIKEGDHAITVIVAVWDNVSKKYYVMESTFGKYKKSFISEKNATKNEFMELYTNNKNGWVWGPVLDKVTHWMYKPDPPITKPNIETEETKDEN